MHGAAGHVALNDGLNWALKGVLVALWDVCLSRQGACCPPKAAMYEEDVILELMSASLGLCSARRVLRGLKLVLQDQLGSCC